MAAAVRQVLVQFIPDQVELVEGAFVRALSTVREGPAKWAGIATGQAMALATLARRQADGADQATRPVHVPKPGAGEYQFTAPFDVANLPGWGRVQPFGIVLDERQLHDSDSCLICCAHAVAEGGKLVLGAHAGPKRLAEVFRKAGFTHFRRAAETPFNLIDEVRR